MQAVTGNRRLPWRSHLRLLCVTACIALLGGIFVRTFLVQAFRVPSPSMEPGLQVGDHILVNKFIYGGSRQGQRRVPWLPMREPRRGDVVVVTAPDQSRFLVKRCLGLPGDTLQAVDRRLVVNHRVAAEAYLKTSSSGTELAPLTVPLDRYFLLGDHRSRSIDSRTWGSLAANHLVGRPIVVYWSVESVPDRAEADKLAPVPRIWHRESAQIRWGRLLRPIR